MKLPLAGAFVALLIAAPAALAQGRVSEFLGVQNWHGTVKITGTGSGSTSGGPYSDVWQYGITSTANFVLDTYDPLIQGWVGTFTGTSNINASDAGTIGGCTENFSDLYQGPLPTGKTFVLILQGTNQYAFYPYDYEVQNVSQTTTNTCAPGTLGGTGPLPWSPVLSDKIQTLPATGFALKGSISVRMDSPLQPLSLVLGGSAAYIDVTITWDIEPGLVAPAEVVVSKTSALENWRPTAGAGGDAGNSIDLIAKLQAQGGGSTNVKAAYFTWQLTKSSKEPGYAMNAPINNPGQDFDLKLESGPDNLFLTDVNAQTAESRPGEYTQSTVTVAPYDWGAFGKIKVTAHMPDGSELVGYLEGDPSQTDIRLPLRSDSSLIADVWKKSKGVEGLADVTDNEDDPPGDGSPGDGLSLYEEYRGFVIDGQHVEGNVKKKDFFVLNTAGQSYQPAFKLFQNLSGLEVHDTLRQSDLPASRVINPNFGEGAHNVDQHGIVIVAIAADANYAKAIGGPGTPAAISRVVTPTVLPGAAAAWQGYLQQSLTHELFHACNVWHHGDAPYQTITLKRLATDVILGNGLPTRVLTEDGASAAPLLPVNVNKTIYMGVANDCHTGDDNCVMRYDDSSGYISSADPSIVYYTPNEPVGYGLCTSPQGTGINEPGRLPQPRYGDAAAGRGNCRGQILVNDGVSAPRR